MTMYLLKNSCSRITAPHALVQGTPISFRHLRLSSRRGIGCAAARPSTETSAVAERISSNAKASTSSGASEVAPTTTKVSASEGILELLTCSMLWGTYNPAMRFIYESDLHLNPSTLTFVRTIGAASAMLIAVGVRRMRMQGSNNAAAAEQQQAETVALDDEPCVPHPVIADKKDTGPMGKLLNWTSSSVIIAGIELGIYNFLGTSTQAVGLQMTSATRAGFLVQLTAVLVPLLSYLAGERVSTQVVVAVVLGLMGSCLVAYGGMSDSMDVAASAGGLIGAGEAFVLLACVFYSLAVVRLSVYAPRFNSVDLTAVKKVTLCGASLVWWLSSNPPDWLTGASSAAVADMPAPAGVDMLGPDALFTWAIVLYSSLAPGALATFLQTRGQSSVPATQAQVIYSTTPIWSAFFAYVTLGGSANESMGPLSWVGGAVILFASLLAAQSQAQAQGQGQGQAEAKKAL